MNIRTFTLATMIGIVCSFLAGCVGDGGSGRYVGYRTYDRFDRDWYGSRGDRDHDHGSRGRISVPELHRMERERSGRADRSESGTRIVPRR